MLKARLVGSVLAAAILFAQAAPLAATASKVSGTAQVRLDPENGDVRSSLQALAQVIGATIVGDSPQLSAPAPAAPITGTPDKLLKRLLKGQDYVLKTDAKGRISQIVIMSGSRGPDPKPQPRTTPPPSTQASVTSPSNSASVNASLLANAQLAQLAQTTPSNAPQKAPTPPIDPGKPTQPASPAFSTPKGPVPAAPPITITPEMQAQIAAATRQASGDLQTLVEQLKAACPAGQRC